MPQMPQLRVGRCPKCEQTSTFNSDDVPESLDINTGFIDEKDCQHRESHGRKAATTKGSDG